MQNKSVSSHFDLFEAEQGLIEEIGPQGCFVMVNHSRNGPEFMHSTYPRDWQVEYDSNSFHAKDPAFMWSLVNRGQKRWSEIRLPDVAGIYKKARRHGLIYGAIFSRGLVKKSVLSVGRDDRELTDQEMETLANWFDEFINICNSNLQLTPRQLDVLQCLANDMTVEEAATNLEISQSAVKKRLSDARKQVGCKTNYFLVAGAARANLIR